MGSFRSVICLRVLSARPEGGCQRGSWVLSLRKNSNVLRKSSTSSLTVVSIFSPCFGISGTVSEWSGGVVNAGSVPVFTPAGAVRHTISATALQTLEFIDSPAGSSMRIWERRHRRNNLLAHLKVPQRGYGLYCQEGMYYQKPRLTTRDC